MAIERLFSGLPAGSFFGFVKVAMYMTREVFLGKTFFARIFRFWFLYVVGAETVTTPGNLFQQFLQNSFPPVSVTIWGEAVYFKSFCIFSKLFGNLWKHLFHRKFKRIGPNCNLAVQKSNPKFFYWMFGFLGQRFCQDLQTGVQNYQKKFCKKRFS